MTTMHKTLMALGLPLLFTSTTFAAPAQSNAGYAFEKGYPTRQAAQLAQDDADYQRAMIAYRFWYPTVSAEGIMEGNRMVGLKDNEGFGIAITTPRQVGFTLNSDTPYGAAVLDLSKGPWVIELPSGAYIGLADDHNQRWILDMGIPGPDGGKGGKHLLLPPDYQGDIPTGYHVGRSDTYKVFAAIRSLPTEGDAEKALKALGSIKIYPLSDAADPRPIKAIDNTQRDVDSTSLRWEDNFKYWEILKKIVDEEPTIDKYLPMYSLLAEVGIEKGKPFQPDARMKKILGRAAKDGRDQMLVSAFASSRAERIAWPDRKWEWAGLVPDNGNFDTPYGMDLDARDRWFAQAIVTSPAMFHRTAGAGSLYWLGLRDKQGAYLDGGKTYKLTVPQPVPNKLFWSITVYDAKTRSEIKTSQNNAALRSLFELKDLKTSEPATLYFGPKAPAGQENRWIKTIPGQGWFAYFRIYGPEDTAFDGGWKPGDFEEVK